MVIVDSIGRVSVLGAATYIIRACSISAQRFLTISCEGVNGRLEPRVRREARPPPLISYLNHGREHTNHRYLIPSDGTESNKIPPPPLYPAALHLALFRVNARNLPAFRLFVENRRQVSPRQRIPVAFDDTHACT